MPQGSQCKARERTVGGLDLVRFRSNVTTERHKHINMPTQTHKRGETKLTPAKTNLLYDVPVLMFVLLLSVVPSLLLIIQY